MRIETEVISSSLLLVSFSTLTGNIGFRYLLSLLLVLSNLFLLSSALVFNGFVSRLRDFKAA